MCGNADPQKARKENEFALRAIFGISLSANALHASTSYATALAEAEMLFPEVEQGMALRQGDSICGGSRRQLVPGDASKSLKEPVIVVLCHKVLEEEEHYNVIDSLMREDFRITNIRQTWLSVKQATELAGAMGQRFFPHPCTNTSTERGIAGGRSTCSRGHVYFGAKVWYHIAQMCHVLQGAGRAGAQRAVSDSGLGTRQRHLPAAGNTVAHVHACVCACVTCVCACMHACSCARNRLQTAEKKKLARGACPFHTLNLPLEPTPISSCDNRAS